jgi:hypothetical protein
MIVSLFTLAVTLPAAPVPAPKSERPEAGKPPPRVVWIAPARDGKFTLVDTVTVYAQVQKQKTVQEGVVARAVTWTEIEARPVMEQRILEIESVNFYGLDGKKIESKEVRKRLTRDMPALMSCDGKPVDRFYLKMAREGTLVLVIPPSAATPREEAKPVPERKRPAEFKK